MKNDFAFVILCWRRPDRIHTLKYLKKINWDGRVILAIDNADPCKDDYINVATAYNVEYFTFDKDVTVADQMYNQRLKSGAVCTRKIVENIMRGKNIKFFCVLDDDYQAFYNNVQKPIPINKTQLAKIVDNYCEILEKIPFVYVMSLAQCGEAVAGVNNFYLKSKFKLKTMNFRFCSIAKPIEYAGIMNDDVNAGILLNKFGKFGIQYAGLFISQVAAQSNKNGGMKDIYAEQSAMYQKAMFSVMLAPSFVKLGFLKAFTKNGKRTYRIYHNIIRQYAYPYIIEM